MRRKLSAVGLLLALTLGAAGPAARGAPPREGLILDETAYCRAHVQFGMDRFSPAGLKADGQKVLGPRGMWDIQGPVKRWLGKDFNKETWTEYAFHSFQWLQYGGTRDAANPYAYTAPAPTGWTKPEFDDSLWLWQRRPFMVGTTHGWFRRAGFFRFRFSVPPPAEAGRLTLELAYRGGARIFLNGTEIARGHLEVSSPPAPAPKAVPAGTLRGPVRGEDYPPAAYVKLNPGGSIVKVKDRKGRGDSLIFVGELPESWDQAAVVRDRKRKAVPGVRNVARRWIDRATFDKVARLRHRAIGPVALPAKLLRAGVNVLAVEIHTSDIHPVAVAGRQNWKTPYYGNVAWSHGQITSLRLTCQGGEVPSVLTRPPGVAVWAEDMHRHVVSGEFMQTGVAVAPLRFVGACNGVFSGQVVVSTDRELTALAVTPSDLKAEGGAAIPAKALEPFAMVPHGLDEWYHLGWGRGGMPHCRNPLVTPAALALLRHGGRDAAALPREQKIERLKTLSFFDHVGPPLGQAPAELRRVPAGACRAVWVTLTVPPAARAGTYRGTLRVAAAGMEPVDLPVVAEVFAWRVPQPADFQANAALEQSPYGVARQYGVELWSEEHFRLMEAGFRHLAAIGNDWLNVPVVNYTEFGNVRDSMIRWVRLADGALTFDYSILDRYLDLATKHLGRLKVINFVVMHGTVGDRADVDVVHEATGRVENLPLHNRAPEYAPAWKAFASSLHAHMRERGLAESMYWGFCWDSVADAELVRLLGSVAPDVWWTAGPHRGKEQFYFRAYSQLLPFSLTPYSRMGWRKEEFHVLLPRGGGSLIAGPGVAYPFNFRLMVDRSLVVGMNGVGRMGADYWGDTYIKGMRQEGFLRAGMPNHFMLWPGPEGAERSARFMALREGFQETEARIFLEQVLLRRALPEALERKARDVLFQHHRQTLYIPSMNASHKHVELCRDWQDRSRRLFGVAAEAAEVVGLDLDRYAVLRKPNAPDEMVCRIAAAIPARAKAVETLKLRCWGPAPRAWKLAADKPWIVPARTAGTADGHVDVPITLDAAGVPPGQTAAGALTVTDLATGRSQTVEVIAKVSKVFDFASPTATLDRKQHGFIPDDGKQVVNAVPGAAGARPVSFFNRSGAVVSWKASASLPWLSVEPAAGRAGPQEQVTVNVKARPAAADAGFHEAVLHVTEAGGQAEERVPLAVYAIPPYRRPASMPAGKAVVMDPELHKAMLRSRKEWRARWCAHEILYFGLLAPGTTERGERVANRLVMPAPAETIYSLQGRGFRAMSVKVDLPDPGKYKGYKYWNAGHAPPPKWIRLRFEVYIDGRLRAASGWISVADGMQTLVVENLADAKTLRLVTRFEKYPPAAVTVGWWDIRFYQ